MLPAPAGMVPDTNDPTLADVECSPRPWGWSRRTVAREREATVLPARAGMILTNRRT
ncbi:hypothetical protein ACFVSQ_38480 [Streptomyces niveus]|uniref:hypothetical protein n=1 Tax=Streptomyces niveus TaxID=193462 RepID=UPI0036E8427C